MKRLLSFLAAAVLAFSIVPAAHAQPAPTHYDLTIEVRPPSHDFVASGIWTVPASDIENGPERYARRSLVFLSSEKLLDLKLSLGRSTVPYVCRPADGQLECRAKLGGPARTSYALRLSYRSDGKPAPQIRVDPDQAFAGSSGDYWYPQLPSGRETATLTFRTPKEFFVVAPGRMKRRSIDGESAVTEYAAEGPVKLGFAAAPFVVQGGGACTVYLLRGYDKAREVSDGCARTAEALTRVWGPFPGGDVKIVEVNFKGVLLGIGESGYILADSSEIRRSFQTIYWAHELSHQWWGSSVSARWPSPAASMLTEGMAEYGALSASREIDGADGLADYLSDRHLPDPSGAPLPHYLLVLARHEDEALSDVKPGDGLSLHYVVTSKGVLVVDALSRVIGDDVFRRLCQEFLSINAGKAVTWADLEAFLASRSGKDLSWFHTQWFDQTGLPQLYATWAPAGDGIDVTLHQCGAKYRLDSFPLQVRSEDADGSFRSETVYGDFEGSATTVHFAAKKGVYRVNPDPDHLTPWLPGLCS